MRQQSWRDPTNQNNKLLTIKPDLGEWFFRIAYKSPRRNYLSPSSHWSFMYYVLLSPERKRTSMYTLQCTFNYKAYRGQRGWMCHGLVVP